MSFRKIILALLGLFFFFFFLIFSFQYRYTLDSIHEIVIEDLRKTVLDMKLDIKTILLDRTNVDIKAYLYRERASYKVIDNLYLTKDDGVLVSTSDDLYAKSFFQLNKSVALRNLEREDIGKVNWIHSFINIMNNAGEEHYQLYVKIDHQYIAETIRERIMMQMLFPILFFVGLILIYFIYIKRMIIKPVIIIDDFLCGVIDKIPKFYILEFNNLAKSLENNLNTLKTIAYTDTLTALYNRKGIEEIVKEQIIKFKYDSTGFAMAMVDLDNFKKVNDTSGHDTGDILLQEVSKALKKEIREVDKIGRLGGDEFLLVFEHESIEQLSHSIVRIIERFQKPFMVNGKEFFMVASIGVVLYPEDGGDITSLFKHVDFAMYKSKKEGGNRFSFFSKELGDKIKKELALEQDIKNALDNGEFFLVYQPIFDMQSEKIVSVEALVRWKEPKKGIMDPSYFIYMIESGFCVKEFGEWVIETACAQQQEWLTRGIDITLSINLSVKHIMSTDFDIGLANIIERYHIDLDKIYFEITEYTLMEYKGATLNILKKMKKNGYHFTLDDFGTGYSSITYLKNTPIEFVKIDKSFIDEIEPNKKDAQMLDAILSLTKVIGLKSIAEGVEKSYQVDYLKDAGCDMVQGFYYSKPLDSKDFEPYYWSNVSFT